LNLLVRRNRVAFSLSIRPIPLKSTENGLPPPRQAWQTALAAFPSARLNGNSMNKQELIAAVAATAELSKADAARAVDAFVSTISETLAAGDSVTLVGFGTFAVKARAARTGRNPQTGEEIKIKASKNPTFKAGKALKDAL